MCEVLWVRRCFCFGSSVFNMPAWWQMLNAKQFHNVFLKDLRWEKGDAVTESWFVFDQHCLVPGFHQSGALGWTLINFMADWDASVQFRHINWSINSPCRTHRAPRNIRQWIRCACIFMRASVRIWRKPSYFWIYSWLFYTTDFYASLV